MLVKLTPHLFRSKGSSTFQQCQCRSLRRKDRCRPGVNFINILGAAFTRTDLKSAKKNDSLTVFFVPLKFACIKAACKLLMKLTPACFHLLIVQTRNKDSLKLY